MGFWEFLKLKKPDISRLREQKDISGLVRALKHKDFDIQWQAAEALSMLGTEAVDHLISSLRELNRDTRIGVIEALGEIKNKRAAPALVHLLGDESIEIRWASALALGEIGDPRAMKYLVMSLADSDRYVRYGAALALEKMGWHPSNEAERVYLYLGKQEWVKLGKVGEEGTKVLISFLKDKDKEVRIKVIEILGASSDHRIHEHCYIALADEHPAVRWKAVLTSLRCGVPHIQLPWGVSKRPRSGRNPYLASLINFVNPGQGYTYTDAWWGIVVWNIYTLFLLVVLYFKYPGGFPILPEPFFWFYTIYGWMSPGAWINGANIILFPFPIVSSIHVWFRAKRMQELK